jgi:hypothetical protein
MSRPQSHQDHPTSTDRATVADKYRSSAASIVLPESAADADGGASDNEVSPHRQPEPADQPAATGRAKAVDQYRNFTEPIATPGGAMSIAQFCVWASIGRTKFYAEVKAGRIKLRKIGSKSVVLRSDGEAWLQSLPVA